VIILDCCRSEKAINSPSIRQRNYSNTEIINEDFFGSGKIIISASSNYQESLELDDLENGLFTYYFLEGLKSRTLIEANGYVSIKKLYDYTFSKIISNHPSIDQRPIFSGEDYSGEIIIRVESKKDLQRDFNFEHADLSKKTKAKLKWDKIYEKNHLDFGLLGRLRKIIQYGNVIVLSDSLRVMSYLACALLLILLFADFTKTAEDIYFEGFYKTYSIIGMIFSIWVIRKLNKSRSESGHHIYSGMLNQMDQCEKLVVRYIEISQNHLEKKEKRIDLLNRKKINTGKNDNHDLFVQKKSVLFSDELEVLEKERMFVRNEQKAMKNLLSSLNTVSFYYQRMLSELNNDPRNGKLTIELNNGMLALYYFQSARKILLKKSYNQLSNPILALSEDLKNLNHKLISFMKFKM
jgi:hypothetical protein